MNATTGLQLILKENEESCFGRLFAIQVGRRLANNMLSLQLACVSKFFFQLLQATQKESHTEPRTHGASACIPVCLLALVPAHLSPDGSAGPCSSRASQLEEALTGPVSMQMVLGDKSLG